ncbi:MAG: metal ABC transporter substrate-binding protein [Anaerolineales bacterium]|jgi:ABC-type Zn uptake system ZnuABC Zn-binding protein ZnuA
MRKKHPAPIEAFLLALLAVLAIAGCTPQAENHALVDEAFLSEPAEINPVDLEAGSRLKVVATTNIVQDVVSNVAADLIELEALIPRGADPHAYEPTPGDLRKLARADLVFLSGVGLEQPLYATLSEIAADSVIVSLSEGIPLQSFDNVEGVDSPDGEAHIEGGMDPHVWMDPLNVQTWIRNASEALSAADPAHSARYQSNAADYDKRLLELHAWIEEQVSTIPPENRKLVSDHRALGYFSARYGFELVATVIPGYSTAAEPSARELGRLMESIDAESAQAIFVGSNVNSTLAQRVAEDSGIQIVPLYIGSLSQPEGPAGSYIEMMKYNVKAITNALRPGG